MRPFVVSQPLKHLQAVRLREVHVEKYELGHNGGLAEEVVDSFFTVLCDNDLVHFSDDAVLAEGAHGEDDLITVVLDEQNGLLIYHDVQR